MLLTDARSNMNQIEEHDIRDSEGREVDMSAFNWRLASERREARREMHRDATGWGESKLDIL